jgi:hypothetical protein
MIKTTIKYAFFFNMAHLLKVEAIIRAAGPDEVNPVA